MSNTLRISFGASANGQAIGASAVADEVSGDSMLQLAITIASDASDAAANCVIDEDTLAGFFMVSDVDCTVKTNSDSAAQETFDLSAGVPVYWTSNSSGAKPISDDLTALYITNDSSPAAAGTLYLVAVTDATP